MAPQARSARGRGQANQADQAPETALAVFDPVLAGRELTAAIDQRRPQLAALLGYEADSERGRAMLDRFVTVALHAATRPEILKATRESLVEAIRDSAVLGLEPVGATGDGAIVIYNEKVRNEVPSPSGRGTIIVERTVPVAHFQPMYRGLLKLARRSSQIASIDAHIVHEGDEITLDLGSTPKVVHYPELDGAKRGNVVGAYAVAELTNGRRYVEYMTYADLEAVRKVSRANTSGPWVSFWGEMARKTVLRRLMKRLPLETMAEHAMRLESEAEGAAVPPIVEPREVEAGGARDRLRSRFGGDQADPVETPAGDGDGAEAPSGDSDPTLEAGEADARLSGRSSASESGDPSRDDAEAAQEAVEGQVREVPAGDVASGDPVVLEAGETIVPAVCGAPAPTELGFAEGTTCVLATGHAFPDGKPNAHQDQEGSRWPNKPSK